MKSLRFVLASCVFVALSNALILPAHAGNTYTGADYSWPDSPGVGHLGLYIDDDISHTRLMSTVRTESGQLCNSLDDSACANQSVRTYSILPRCETDVQKDCVESLGATSQGVASEGVFSRYFPEQGLGDFEGNPAMNIPTGAAPSIFTLPGVSHSDGNEYMVIASVNGVTPTGGVQAPSSITIHASVYPVKVLAGNFMRNTPTASSFGVNHRSSDKWGNCASIADGYCAARQDFPANTRFSLSLRLSTPPNGWLHGRIFSPTVTYETTGSATRLKVDASPVQVAAVATWGRYSELPEAAKNTAGGTSCSETSMCSQMNPQSGGAYTAVEAWRSVYGDKASWVRGQWMYQTLVNYDKYGSLASCTSEPSKFDGFITTNATGYAAGPPVFEPSSKTLSYVVAAPHTDAEGGLIVGTYDLMMRSELAACLYGANANDIVGSVSVVYDTVTGTTTDFKTDVSNDGTWLKVSASGFHYSMPTIKTTLSSKSGVMPIAKSGSSVIKKSVSARTLALRAQFVVARGDVFSLHVSNAWLKNCTVVRQTLRILKTGKCRVTVRVESRTSKPRFRAMTLNVKK